MTRKTSALLIAVVSPFLILPKITEAQIKVTSEFLKGPDADHVNAHCVTDASTLSKKSLLE